MPCSMSRFILIALLSWAIIANSVESGFVTSTSGSRFVKRSGVRNMAVPLDTLQVSRQAECVLRCMRRHGCHCCNLGPINNVTKNRACELLSGENISPATGGAAADWTMFVGKIIYCTFIALFGYCFKPSSTNNTVVLASYSGNAILLSDKSGSPSPDCTTAIPSLIFYSYMPTADSLHRACTGVGTDGVRLVLQCNRPWADKLSTVHSSNVWKLL